jgi:nitroreductase
MTYDDLLRLMERQRAIRLFSDRPVPDDVIEKLLKAATHAPSARNLQPWRFIVIRDSEVRRRLGAIFDELGQQLYGAGQPERTRWEDVPVLIAVASEYAFGRTESGIAALGASIYPAVQNLLLAAQALGLGTVLTTRWKAREPEVLPLLGLPESMTLHAIMPLGWPVQRHGRNRRRPVSEVTFRDRFARPW